MGNCLVTKLKGTVDNPDLLKLGEIEVIMHPSGTLGWYGTNANPIRLRNKSSYFTNKTTGDHETSISIGAVSNYSLDQKSLVVIENPGDLLYMEDPCDLLDGLYKALYLTKNYSWSIQSSVDAEKPAVTFAKAVDNILNLPPNNVQKLFIKGYDFEGQNFNALANHPLVNKLGSGPAAYIDLGMSRLTIDPVDITKLSEKITNFELFKNYCGGTIEDFVAAARIAWPNKTSFDLMFDCMLDRKGFITTTFDGQNITLYENTYWSHHPISWTANTITFMGKTIDA